VKHKCKAILKILVIWLYIGLWSQLIRATRHPPCTALAYGVHSLSTSGHRVITNKRCAVNQCTPRGQRVNAAWTTNCHFGMRWQCAVNARQACEQRVLSEWSTRRPRVKCLGLRRSGDAGRRELRRELI
jgi:hypothetical protein